MNGNFIIIFSLLGKLWLLTIGVAAEESTENTWMTTQNLVIVVRVLHEEM